MPIKRLSRADIDLSKVDWSRLDATTEAEIDAQIAADADTAPEIEGAEGWTVVRNVPVPDVKAIRGKLKFGQAQFAAAYGFSKRTVQQWEQKRAAPDPHTRLYLGVIERYPAEVRGVAEAMMRTEGKAKPASASGKAAPGGRRPIDAAKGKRH